MERDMTTSPVGNGPSRSEVVTFREIYTLIQSVRAEILAELTKVSTELDTRLEKHAVEHKTEKTWRTQLSMWAVTTILSAGGIAFTIWLGVTDKI